MKNFTRGLGAVKLIRAVGWKVLPKPDFGGPSSIFQDEGASTAVTGSFVSSMALMTAGNGSRTSPEKLKPANDEWDAITAEAWILGQTEDCINYVVRGIDRPWEIFGERNL